MNEPREAPFWQRGVLYQIYPRSFKDTDGDGVGDLEGIRSELEYLRWLGIDALWLSPIYPSPMADFGYDVSDYTDVDPLFGDLPRFDRLLSEAHRLDLRVLLDFVPNHTSEKHPWFVESRASRKNARRDWYVWADAKADGSPPNNWLSVFGGRAWEWDEATRQFYLHTFLKEQPDLNWRSPLVRAAMYDVMRFWLRRGVDGFRVDAPEPIAKDPLLRDNPPNLGPPKYHRSHGEYDTQLHVYNRGHADIHEFFREMRAVTDEFESRGPRVLVGEIHDFDWPRWSTYYGPKLDELHMPFNFGLLATPWKAGAVRALVDAIEGALLPGAQPNYVFGNHDEPRIASRIGPSQARIAMMLLLTLRGTPTLYYGDELGMLDVSIPPEREQDPWGLRNPGRGLSRDPARTPMRWNGGANAGFCDARATPWLPIGDDFRDVNCDHEKGDPGSMLSLTRSLLALRRSSPALSMGSYRPLESHPECFAFERRAEGERYVIALNFSASDIDPHLNVPGAKVAISTHRDREAGGSPAALTLRAHEGCVIVATD